MTRLSIKSNKPGLESLALTPGYLVDTGLLAELNRQMLHPFGMALCIAQGGLGLKDYRAEPERALLDRAVAAQARGRFESFLREMGFAQMDRRARKLGWSTQPVECWVR